MSSNPDETSPTQAVNEVVLSFDNPNDQAFHQDDDSLPESLLKDLEKEKAASVANGATSADSPDSNDAQEITAAPVINIAPRPVDIEMETLSHKPVPEVAISVEKSVEPTPVEPTPAPVSETPASDAASAPVAAPSAEASGGPKAIITDDLDSPVQFLSLHALAKKFETNLDFAAPRNSHGLTDEEAAARLQRDGPNILSPPPELPEIVKYLMQYLDPFMLLLNLAGILSCIAYGLDKSQPVNLYIGIVLFVVVFISCTFSYVQAGKASAVMKSFKNMMPRQCHVVRGGRPVDVPAADLVKGDIVRVSTGDQIPADIRIIYTQDLKVELSSLTGEALPVKLTTTTDIAKIEEARNLGFNTSKCLEGEAIGVVYATGDQSLIGTIANMASSATAQDTTLQREIKYFVRNLTIFAVTLGIIFFIVGVARGQKLIDAFINGFIVVVIANVPEGLPMTVTSALTITARRMGALKVFVKQLQSVETLGSATVIASDKTGTLTQNKMSVSRFWFDQMKMEADTISRDMPSFFSTNKEKATNTFLTLELIAGCCNRARYTDSAPLTDEQAESLELSEFLENMRKSSNTMTLRSARAVFPSYLSRVDPSMTIRSAWNKFHVDRNQEREVTAPDASEHALFNFVSRRSNIELIRYHWPSVFELPFNSRNKFAITVVRPHKSGQPTDKRRRLLMKGAPEVILTRCSHYMVRGETLPIDDNFRNSFQDAYEFFGGQGERVLGFAYLELDVDKYGPHYDKQYSAELENFPMSGLTFVGLISLVDPPKDTVPDSILACRRAGIRVIMVTGDHPLTAASIARKVHIIEGFTRDQKARLLNCSEDEIDEDDYDAVVVKGTDLEKFSDADWDRVLRKKEIVFARTTPAQKLQIVTNLQRLGEIVAVTGDGVNDSPALKKADIGVAMGISGSDVARDAADVILMNDDFSSIVVGIREGRTIFDNLTKTVAYTVTHMVPEVTPVLLNLAAGLPMALSAFLILVIDLGTELCPSVSLAYEDSESDVMNRPPRNSKTDRLVSWKVALYFLEMGAIYTLVCFMSFFLVFDYYGIPGSTLALSSDKYFKDDAEDLYVGDNKFDAAKQTDILKQAQTAYWAMLVMSQIFHIFMCKTRVLSVFEHGFGNAIMNMGVLVELSLVVLIIFVPSSHTIFQTSPFPGKFWPIFLLSWFFIFLWNEGRKYWGRKNPKYSKWLLW